MHCMLEKMPMADPGRDVFVMPCSTAQKRFWMLEQMSPGDTALVIPIAVQLSGPLRIDVLERALNRIVERHEILRTSFGLVEGEPKQIIASEADLELHRLDLGNIAVEQRRERIAGVMAQEAKRPVPITRAPLLRATLVELAPQEAVLMLTAHHIISDGWSNGILVRELGVFYHALLHGGPVDLPPLAIQYADYVLWQEEWLNSPAFERQMGYWKKELESGIPRLDFPADFARRSDGTHEAILESRLLPAELTLALKGLCRETGTTLFMIFFSAYVALLRRYTGQSNFVVASTGANRNRPELEDLIGLFSNLLFLRSDVADELSFRDFLAAQRDHLLESFSNHEAPFEKVHEQGQSGKSRLPRNLIQTHFLFQKAFMQPTTRDGLTIQPLYSVSPGSTFELTFGIVERAEGIRLQMEYWTSLFRRSTIQQFLGHFQALLEAAVANPGTPLAQLPFFAPGEREKLEFTLRAPENLRSEESRVLDLPKIYSDFDRQIDEHFRRSDAPFTINAKLPSGLVLVALDQSGRLLPAGVPGDLHLADHFGGLDGRGDTVTGPAADSLPLLKTGFVGRHTRDGGVDFLGRADDIVRLPGFRFNRLALESRLRTHAEVRDAFSLLPAQESGEPKLIGYVVLKPNAKATPEELRAYLRERISDLLVPSVIVVVAALPRDAQGKVRADELALPVMAEKKAAPHQLALHGMVQHELIAIWRNILNIPDISIDDNFFELGGNSFLALRMMTEAGKLARRTLPLSLLLTGATVANLSRAIMEGNGADNGDARSVIPVQPKGAQPPLYFLHGDWVGGGFYCNRLSQHLGEDQPFYALPPSRSPDGKTLSISEMAAQHRAIVEQQSPQGPYFLGGYCIGALVAMEMARQWIAEGKTVAHLFLVDPPVWSARWLGRAWPWIDRLGHARGWSLRRRITFFDRSVVATNRWLHRPISGKLPWLSRLIAARRKSANDEAAPSTQGEEAKPEVLTSLDYAVYFLAYRLHRIEPLSVPATLFIPESTSAWRLARIQRAAKIAAGKCRVVIVPGNHTTCVTRDSSAIAEQMRVVLEKR